MTETHAEKAQRLVDEGRVSVWQTTKLAVRAYVRDGSRLPVAVYSNGHCFCGCAERIMYSHADDLCVHAEAVKLAVEMSST